MKPPIVFLAVLVAAAANTGQAPNRGPMVNVDPPRFTDPQRRMKLASAFADIDRIFRGSAERTHVPGAAWGIVIDGELAHTASAGYRELAAKAPVDADTVFRIASMTKSFTAMSILKLRDEGKPLAIAPAPADDSPRGACQQ